MTTLTQLQEQRGVLVTQARAALDEIRSNTDDSRAAELEARHDKIMADFDKLEANIAREERVAAAERSLAERQEQINRERRPTGEDRTAPAAQGEGISYRDAFRAFLAAGGQLGDMEPEARARLREGRETLKGKPEQRAQTTSATAGGYTVPVELANIIVRSMKMWGPMYDEDVCTVLTTSGGYQLNMPTVDDTSVTAEITPGEGVTWTDDGGKDATFGTKRLDAFLYQTEWLRISLELAQDSDFDIESLIGSLLGERLGRVANLQLTTGDGTGDPNGVVTASTSSVTAALATAVTFDELISLEHSVDPAYRTSPKCAFMFNDNTLAFIRKIKDGEGNYIWNMGNVQNGVAASLLGRRYWINQAMANIATGNKPILFGDFGKYFVRKVGAPVVAALQDKDFFPGFGMAGYVRLDGELGDTAAVKHILQP